MNTVLECRDLCKAYGSGPPAEVVLRDVSLSVAAGRTCVLLGPSGSGKTTLLSIFGCLLAPTAGELRLRGECAAGTSASSSSTRSCCSS